MNQNIALVLDVQSSYVQADLPNESLRILQLFEAILLLFHKRKREKINIVGSRHV